jgi:hypothetical protein
LLCRFNVYRYTKDSTVVPLRQIVGMPGNPRAGYVAGPYKLNPVEP